MRVEIWSDLACPWCYIGKRNFDGALERFDGDVEVVWRSFQLAPDMPDEIDGSLNEYLAARLGVSLDEAAAMNARVSGVAAEAGLEYHLDVAQPSNTFDAHRLAKLGGAPVVEALFRAYFSEGKRLADPAVLAEVAAGAGLDPSALEGDAFAAEVREDIDLAAQFGLSGVPAFVIDRQYLVSGAQPPDALLGALERAASGA